MVAHQATKLALVPGMSQIDEAITSTAFGTNDIGLFHAVTSHWGLWIEGIIPSVFLRRAAETRL
jgi:hypothetical protein